MKKRGETREDSSCLSNEPSLSFSRPEEVYARWWIALAHSNGPVERLCRCGLAEMAVCIDHDKVEDKLN